ncbi:hypothetical protein NDU88_006873 [Pleurodeles waltl]|uniref:Uncharacterized protein n=1 Tax=Pleurodeles waltl TaxID=8319 RepID=A0AAV7RQP9_PLEWA|nr:hypothetical protein NDU88_006873 [Pleurodeles waltl]
MGKLDKTQAKLQFDRRKAGGPSCEDAGPGPAGGPSMPAGEEKDLRQILVAMQHSLTQIDGKIDSLSYRMDRMSKRLDKHVERPDQAERRISEVEDGQTELNTAHTKQNKSMCSLQAKVDDLEARSKTNNLRKVGMDLRKVVADPGGRYIVTRCEGSVAPFLLVGIYGPSFDNPHFYYDLATKVDSWGGLSQIWGEASTVRWTLRFKDRGGDRRLEAAARAVMKVASDLGMVNAWRDRHPGKGGYMTTQLHIIYTHK